MDEPIREFLAERVLAVVGVSRTRGFGGAALKALRRSGHRVYPVNAAADEVLGERCWRSLRQLPEVPGGAVVVVPPDRALDVLRDCAAIGVRRAWLQRGAESQAARALARELGVALVAGECIVMYAAPRGIHRLHRWLHARRTEHGARSTRADR